MFCAEGLLIMVDVDGKLEGCLKTSLVINQVGCNYKCWMRLSNFEMYNDL